jgi:STE24 endopeptidase
MALIPPDAKARSDAYFEGGYWIALFDFVVGLLVAWLLLDTQLSSKARDWIEKRTRFKWLQTGIYAAFYIAFTSVVTVPWNFYESYVREHQYNMSNQDLAGWLGDQLKGLALALVLGSIALTVLYAVVRKVPQTWWLWGALVSMAFIVFTVTIAPTFLEPVFNKFTPLPESPIKSKILSMARSNGIPATDVFEFDASKQTRRMSAHVSGMLGTTQISMNDNLMNRGSPEEIEAVLGHEMGHYVLNHVYKGIVFFGIITLAGFAFLRWAFERVRTRFSKWGIRDVTDVAGLPLLAALFSIWGFVLSPVQNTITRTMEAEADAFGINTARQPDGIAFTG